MNLKGTWDAAVTYNKEDVVWYDGFAYHLQNPAPAGASPADTRYWGKLNGVLCDVVKMAMDVMDTVPDNINDEAIVLKGTGDAEYAITIDDSGDTPDLAVTAIEEEEGEG